jgi:integrase
MTMRFWRLPKASASRLAALVDDVHSATRLPKHLIMGALINVVDRHRPFKMLVRRLGLPPVRFHDLRHGAATMLLAAGRRRRSSPRRWAMAP